MADPKVMISVFMLIVVIGIVIAVGYSQGWFKTSSDTEDSTSTKTGSWKINETISVCDSNNKRELKYGCYNSEGNLVGDSFCDTGKKKTLPTTESCGEWKIDGDPECKEDGTRNLTYYCSVDDKKVLDTRCRETTKPGPTGSCSYGTWKTLYSECDLSNKQIREDKCYRGNTEIESSKCDSTKKKDSITTDCGVWAINGDPPCNENGTRNLTYYCKVGSDKVDDSRCKANTKPGSTGSCYYGTWKPTVSDCRADGTQLTEYTCRGSRLEAATGTCDPNVPHASLTTDCPGVWTKSDICVGLTGAANRCNPTGTTEYICKNGLKTLNNTFCNPSTKPISTSCNGADISACPWKTGPWSFECPTCNPFDDLKHTRTDIECVGDCTGITRPVSYENCPVVSCEILEYELVGNTVTNFGVPELKTPGTPKYELSFTSNSQTKTTIIKVPKLIYGTYVFLNLWFANPESNIASYTYTITSPAIPVDSNITQTTITETNKTMKTYTFFTMKEFGIDGLLNSNNIIFTDINLPNSLTLSGGLGKNGELLFFQKKKWFYGSSSTGLNDDKLLDKEKFTINNNTLNVTTNEINSLTIPAGIFLLIVRMSTTTSDFEIKTPFVSIPTGFSQKQYRITSYLTDKLSSFAQINYLNATTSGNITITANDNSLNGSTTISVYIYEM